MEVVQIPAVVRSAFGKKSSSLDRKKGLIPAVMYGSKNNSHFGVTKNDVKSIVYTPDFKLAELDIDGKKYKCIIKDIQFHPVTDEIQHIDFLELVAGKSFKTEIPVEYIGTSLGQQEGGKLVKKLRKIKIKTNVEALVDKLSVDISELDLNESVRVRDIEAIDGIEIMNNESTPVASIEVPRALKSIEAEEEEALAGETTDEETTTEDGDKEGGDSTSE